MNKKLNFCAIFPIYGSCVLLFVLFIKMLKHKINRKKFYIYFFSCGLFGFLSILLIIMALKYVNYITNYKTFIDSYGILIGFIIGGYVMNLFTFLLINKHYNDLEKY
ncbi:MAG: hypothetical protein J1F31_00895 [Erysipelotrichales bacterium]|nr:hypothetical protein [Erysipelotrichales bacterium]